MSGLTITLVAVGSAGIAMLYLLFIPRYSWNWKSPDIQRAKPFWLGLITLLSLAAIVFSTHALLVVHGYLRI
jgi:hypothetical protein